MQARNNIFITAIIGFTITACLAAAAWILFSGIVSGAKDIMFFKEQQRFFDEQGRAIDMFAENYQAKKQGLDLLAAAFVDAQNPIAFIEFLEKNAEGSGIAITINLVPAGSGKDTATTIMLQLLANGGFEAVMEFLEKLENGPYLISVDTLDIKQQDRQGGQAQAPSGVQARMGVTAIAKP